MTKRLERLPLLSWITLDPNVAKPSDAFGRERYIASLGTAAFAAVPNVEGL